ncbi:MAG: alpha/beta hydrolase [Acetobacteraceae bacterium]
MLTITPNDTDQVGVVRGFRRQPVSFDQCFGWLHAPLGDESSSTAVVLCSGLRHDGMTAYRSFRLLADALADAGYPTLRFDYPGTGNSRDIGTAEHWAEWQQSIHTAADWLRDHSGAGRIILCGLRIGATLAAVVAEQRTDVAGLVLIAPVLRGRSYIRELITETAMGARGTSRHPEDGLAVNELRFSGETVQLINQVELRKVALARGCRVVVYAQSPSPVLSECVSTWARRGADVTCEDFTGLDPMLRPAHMSHEPSADVTRILGWLRESIPTGPPPLQHARVPERAEIRHGSCIETPLRFGPTGNLFGVLCRPSARDDSSMAVVIVNSGGNPHQGLARVNVDLARRLAAEGFASLRMDFAGLGDSIAPGDAETHVLEVDRRADVAAAIDVMEELGYRRFAAQGLCSGAYHAFHAALADQRISVLLLVNLPLFQWRVGDAIEFLSHVQGNPVSLLLQLRQMDVWKRLLQQGPLGLRTRLAMLRVWFYEKIKAIGRRHARFLGFGPPPTFAQDSINRLAQRARTLFLFSEGDAGVAALSHEFGQKRCPPGAAVRIVPGQDHALTSCETRGVVFEHMIGFLKQDAVSLTGSHAWERPSRKG